MLMFKQYSQSQKTGWMGWIETHHGDCVGFIKLNGQIVLDWAPNDSPQTLRTNIHSQEPQVPQGGNFS